MLMLVPVIHRRQSNIGLINGQIWTLGNQIQVAIGDYRSDFNDAIGLGIQPGHF